MIYEPGMTLRPEVYRSCDGVRMLLRFDSPDGEPIFFENPLYKDSYKRLFYGKDAKDCYVTFLKFVMGIGD